MGGVGAIKLLTSRPKLSENSRVLIIGDSLARGMTPHFKNMAEEAEIPLLSIAVNGTRVDQWADSPELAAALIEFDPSHVFVSLGTNDAYSNKDPVEVAEEVQALVELIEETEAHVIWIGVPTLPPISNGSPLHEDILDAIQATAPNYYDSTELTIPRAPDLIHPTVSGYAGWAGAIWNWLT